MGIGNFYKSLRHHYSGAFCNKWLNFYNHVYVDINFALHYCSYNAQSTDEIYIRLFKFLDNMLHELVPTKTLTIGSDGSAPLSKLLLQRKRRMGIFRNLKSDDATSSLMFTPGTIFMHELKNKMNEYIKYIEQKYWISVNYLDADVDEAELKLKKQMMDNFENPLYKNDSHIFISNDADVIIMLTTLENYSNVFVLSKTSKQSSVISIGKLMDLHTDRVGTSINPGLDFTAIGIMLGNDYLPKIYYVDFDKLWDAYKSSIFNDPRGLFLNTDPNNIKINIQLLKNILSCAVIKIKKCFINKLLVDYSFHPLYKNYLDGYMWCLNTYMSGKCKRYNYMYSYQDAPHPLGLIFNISIYPDLLKINHQMFDPINPALYAILVLPKASLCLINSEYHEFAHSNPILYSEECCKICITHHKKITQIYSSDEYDDDKKIKTITSEMTKHRKLHTNITLDDVVDIINKFNNHKINQNI